MNKSTQAAQFCQAQSVGVLQLINIIFLAAKKEATCFLSQTSLGNACGYNRGWANKKLKLLEDNGIITAFYRHRKTKMYWPNEELFKDQGFRYALNVLLQPIIETYYQAKTVLKEAIYRVRTPLNIKLFILKDEDDVHDQRARVREVNSPQKPSLSGRVSSFHDKKEKSKRFWRVVVKINHVQWHSDVMAVLNKQTKVKLTQAGKNELCKFPAESIVYGLSKYCQKDVFKDPFVYLCKFIWDDVKAKGLSINKDLPEKMHDQFGTKPTDLLIEKQSIQANKECRPEAYKPYVSHEYKAHEMSDEEREEKKLSSNKFLAFLPAALAERIAGFMER
jgi:hypothetical protein